MTRYPVPIDARRAYQLGWCHCAEALLLLATWALCLGYGWGR